MYKQNEPRKAFFKEEFFNVADKEILLGAVKVKKTVASQLAYSVQGSTVEFLEYLA